MRTSGNIIPVCRTQLGLNVFSVGEGGKVAPGVLNVLRGTPLDSDELSSRWWHLAFCDHARLSNAALWWVANETSFKDSSATSPLYQHLCALTLLLNTVSIPRLYDARLHSKHRYSHLRKMIAYFSPNNVRCHLLRRQREGGEISCVIVPEFIYRRGCVSSH